MPSQPDQSGDPSLLDWAQDHLGRNAHLVHRLDRPTGGLVIVAKNAKATTDLSRQFQERAVQKLYLAVTDGVVDFQETQLSHFIAKLPGKNFVRAYDKPVRNSKPARLTVGVQAKAGPLTLLAITPETGRRHQIRAQLKTLKLRILGDLKYGKGKPLAYPGLALWARSLRFETCGEMVSVTAEPPRVYPWNEFEEQS